MNNKDFITELAQRTGYSADETQQFVNCVVDAMGDHFQDADTYFRYIRGEKEDGTNHGQPLNRTAYAGTTKTGADIQA